MISGRFSQLTFAFYKAGKSQKGNLYKNPANNRLEFRRIMVLFELLTIVIGILYGYLKPGKEDRMALFKKGLLIGIILALVFIALGEILGRKFLLLIGGAIGIEGIVEIAEMYFIEVIILTILFILGTLIGDWLEEKSKVKIA